MFGPRKRVANQALWALLRTSTHAYNINRPFIIAGSRLITGKRSQGDAALIVGLDPLRENAISIEEYGGRFNESIVFSMIALDWMIGGLVRARLFELEVLPGERSS